MLENTDAGQEATVGSLGIGHPGSVVGVRGFGVLGFRVGGVGLKMQGVGCRMWGEGCRI